MAGWILVTGASGFIGSRLVRALVERGERVKAFVRVGSNVAHLMDLPAGRFQLAYGDITVGHTVFAALAGCSRMYHVASNYKMWDPVPDRILVPAVEGTIQTLAAARERGLEKVVVTSSVASLGVSEADEPMDEGHGFNLSDAEIYVESKRRAEAAALDRAGEVPLVAVLPSAVFGPGDWKPSPSGQGILKYLSWPTGLSFPTTGGGLSIVDVDDVVQGHVAAMEKGRVGERYVLGGDNVSYEGMFGLLHEITGLSRPGAGGPRAVAMLAGWLLEVGARFTGGDPPLTRRLARDYAYSRIWVSSAKAEAELDYRHRPARETLTRAVLWYLEHGYLSARAARRVALDLGGA